MYADDAGPQSRVLGSVLAIEGAVVTGQLLDRAFTGPQPVKIGDLVSIPAGYMLGKKAKEADAAKTAAEEEDGLTIEELEKLFGKLQDLGPKEREAIEYMATAITNKLIHPPTAALKGDTENKEQLVAAIRRLYGIDGERDEE